MRHLISFQPYRLSRDITGGESGCIPQDLVFDELASKISGTKKTKPLRILEEAGYLACHQFGRLQTILGPANSLKARCCGSVTTTRRYPIGFVEKSIFLVGRVESRKSSIGRHCRGGGAIIIDNQ